jgi:hypothetical protein
MAILRKENVIIREGNKSIIAELKAKGYEEVTEEVLKKEAEEIKKKGLKKVASNGKEGK